MIIVTGGAGFIGSAIVWRLNQRGINNILIVDRLGKDEKWKNLVGLDFLDFIDKEDFIKEIRTKQLKFAHIEAVIHMGATSATTETDTGFLMENNYKYTQELATYCVEKKIRFIYASSAATYGDGKKGFDDRNEKCLDLEPLNMYGYSKNLFDSWALKRGILHSIVGIKFFNVYGPNEYHKGEMRSVVIKAFEQIKNEGKIQLFKSLNASYKDGEQMRDFIYVKDAVDMTLSFLENKSACGLFNVGSGKSRTWNDLARALFNALEIPVNIDYCEMPDYLAPKYQYYTQADISKLNSIGYNGSLTSLEDGVRDYVQNYLVYDAYLKNY